MKLSGNSILNQTPRPLGIGLFLYGVLISSLLIFSLLVFPAPVIAATETVTENSLPLIIHRKKKDLNHIYAFERSPLGNRMPVILVPGRAEEYQHNAWWKKFREMSQEDYEFEEYFKLYAFIYDSGDELNRQAEDFNKDFLQHFGHLPPDQPIILITYSLGGVIARDALENQAVLDKIHKIYAIAVPFHGTPIFDPDWFMKYFRPTNHSPIRKYWDHLVYRLYLFQKTNLTRGLKWDNFDSSKPQAIPQKLNEEHLQGDQVMVKIEPYYERQYTSKIQEKMVVYASYLENNHTGDASGFNVKKALLKIPKALVGAVLPFYGGSVHAVFTYMNHQLSNLPTYTPQHPNGKNTHLYRFNDGVIPMSSMLYLPASSEPYEGNLLELVGASRVPKIRIFKNIDHMHIGEYGLKGEKEHVADVLSPDEGRRSPNQWLLYDLKQVKKVFSTSK